MSDLRFRVRATSENPTKTIVKARNFELVVDEPADLGGTDTGANPVEFVLAAFAGCLNVMAHIVANEMKFELKSIQIDIVGDLNPARLFGQSYDERAGYKGIKVILRPDCDASPETLEAWKKAVCDRCPVSDNLKHETPIVVETKVKKTELV